MARLRVATGALLLLLLQSPLAAQSAAPARADIVLRNGKIFVADARNTIVSAAAVRDGKIIAIGSDADVTQLAGPGTRVIDLHGQLVTPGMNDAHLHFANGGVSMLEVDLLNTTSLAEIERRVHAAALKAAPGEWITGRGWDHTRLPASELGSDGWPTRAILDRAAGDHPVYLSRVDGHTGWVNSKALQLAGVTVDTRDPMGGEIARDPTTHEATGILKENANGIVSRLIPPATPDKLRRGIAAALQMAASSGVTSVQTATNPEDLRIYQALRDSGKLSLRVYGWVPLNRTNIESFRRLGMRAPFGDSWVRIGLMKAFADGTLGSRTAFMLEPFSDDPTTRGIHRISQESLDSLVALADATGLQVAIHAIGDAANRMALDAIERAQNANGRRDARHRIEHAQVLDQADIPRFRQLGVIASMQPTHATSDMRWVETRIGMQRAEEGAYAWRKLLDAGAQVIFGTDFDVEPIQPVQGLYSAVTRQSRDKPGTPLGGWLPSQKLTIQEAIRLYTAASAYGEFQEQVKGTLEPGKFADFVVWDRDLLTIPPEQILLAKPVLTVAGGRTVYDAAAASRPTS
jgi:predicted amidohydrolase YtcJ